MDTQNVRNDGDFAIMYIQSDAGAVLRTPPGADDHRVRMNAMRSVRIPLHSRKHPGLFAIVDEADAELVNQYRWNPCVENHTIYAQHSDGKHSIRMHRIIMCPPQDAQVDHINHNGLDNRRTNLRLCSQSENLRNRKGHAGNATGYIGVYFHNQTNKYQGQIQLNGRKISAGLHETPEAAARARDSVARLHFGEFATLNFPEEGDQ